MSDRQPNEEAIFHIARDLADSEKRAAYLEQVCADDPEKRKRIEALLEAHEQEKSFLKSNKHVSTTATLPDPKNDNLQEIGPYKILQKIGEGGFGVVYMAERKQPMRQRVALKIVKPGMDSKAVIARFEAERQALAMMEHPNIARILDGGETKNGRPYFVMDLVKGVPINQFCDANSLTTRQRLELFKTVCHAVQHAHQKGIIHRDLKPSNILVTLNDGEPMPKVIDFGVAKALHHELTDKTYFTQFGQMIGTLQYMSPEQAEMSAMDVDTRSDIYSLGVVLYELLTGSTPVSDAKLRASGYAEIQRIIREEEPPRPSVRLSTLGEQQTIVANSRKTDIKSLRKNLVGELDWIVMKSLEKQRGRRYETANGLAQDVKRYLSDEPVEARPPTTWYTVSKFARRNRGVVSTIAISFVFLIVGLIGALVLAKIAKNYQSLAENAAEDQRKDAHISQMSYAPDLLSRHDIRGLNEVLNRWNETENGADLRRWEWYYLKNLAQTELGVPPIIETPRSVMTTRVSDDGTRIVFTNPAYPMIRILDRSKPRGDQLVWEGANIVGGKRWKIPIEITANGRFAILPKDDLHGIRILDLNQPDSPPVELLDETGLIRNLELSRDGQFLLVTTENQLAVVEMKELVVLWVEQIGELPSNISALAPGFKDNELFLGLANGDIKRLRFLTNYSTNEFEIDDRFSTITAHADEINRLAVSRDGRWLVTASSDSQASVIDLANDTLFRILSDAKQEVRAIGFSRDNKTLWLGARAGGLRAYSIPDFEFVEIVTHKFMGYELETDRANQIYFGGDDNKLFQWEHDLFRSNLVFQSDGWIVDIALSANGRKLATLDDSAQLGLWKLTDTRAIRLKTALNLKGFVQEIFKSPKPNADYFYALVADKSKLKLSRIDWSGNMIDETILRGVSIHPDSGDQHNRRSASGDGLCVDMDISEQVVFVCDPNSNKIWQYDLQRDQFKTLDRDGFTPRWLSWIESEKKLVVRQSFNRGQELIKLDMNSEESETIFRNSDNVYPFVVRQTNDQQLGFVLIEQFRNSKIQRIDGHGKVVGEFEGETGLCGDFKWLDEGKTLVSPLATDGAIRFWDVDSGRERFNIDERPHIFMRLDVSEDESTIAAGTRTGKIFVYRYQKNMRD